VLDIVQAMDHPGLFKQSFDGPSRDNWRAVLKAGFCLLMTAAVAVARKLAVIMHTMLKTGELFNPNAGAAA
jgi:hypothetical protein